MHYNTDFFEFIKKNSSANIQTLRLKYHGKSNEWIYDALLQIECRQRFGKKLHDTLHKFPEFIFPDTLAGEQSTSDLLSEFHAGIVPEAADVTDLTSGLGIDCLHIARNGNKVNACELDPKRAKVLSYNAAAQGLSNINVLNVDSVDALNKGCLNGDVAFIDPARRDNNGSRVFSLSDCAPDVTAILPQLRCHFRTLIAKVSPMLDITSLCKSLPGVSSIYILGTHTECKELVAIVNLGDQSNNPIIHAVTLSPKDPPIVFKYTVPEITEASNAITQYNMPCENSYLYIPYPSVIKAGVSNLLASRYNLNRIAPNTHLFFSERNDIANFPGTHHRITSVIDWQSKNIKKFARTYPMGWVAVRNFGMTAEALAHKLGIKNGGDIRIIGVTDNCNNRKIIVCQI